MTARPLVSVIVPTRGRPTLARTLASIRDQVGSADCEIVMVGDTFGDDFAPTLYPLPAVGIEYRAHYFEADGGVHCVGQPQRQYGMTVATGKWLMFSQDDAQWRDGAWLSIQEALAAGLHCPHLFRVETRHGLTVWDQRGNLGVGHVDADCIATPNEPARLGRWGLEYTGDQTFIRETVDLWGGRVEWEPALIEDSRP